MKTKLIIEPHIHGAFGVDFNSASLNDILTICKKFFLCGIGGIFPTLVTDSIENIKHQIDVIKNAAAQQKNNTAKILGIHLEGIFLNPEKKGIHNSKYFLPLTSENYKKIEDDFIKIITLAPELDNGLIGYLLSKDIKIQAGHCIGADLSGCSGVTHLFNAMKGITHREQSTALSALINDNLYVEIIADGIHLSDEILKLALKTKPIDKIILISDALPIAHSNLTELYFAGEKIFRGGMKAVSKTGTLAGSVMLISDIIKRLGCMGIFNEYFINNPYNYYNISNVDGEILWDENYNITGVRSF